MKFPLGTGGFGGGVDFLALFSEVFWFKNGFEKVVSLSGFCFNLFNQDLTLGSRKVILKSALFGRLEMLFFAKWFLLRCFLCKMRIRLIFAAATSPDGTPRAWRPSGC